MNVNYGDRPYPKQLKDILEKYKCFPMHIIYSKRCCFFSSLTMRSNLTLLTFKRERTSKSDSFKYYIFGIDVSYD